jgi:hypothetical protein
MQYLPIFYTFIPSYSRECSTMKCMPEMKEYTQGWQDKMKINEQTVA